MKILINYSDSKFERSRRWNTFSGKYIAKFDKVYEFHPKDIDADFFSSHKVIFSIKRGNGLWLWKPYFIAKTLKECNDGDIVFYCDAGAIFIRNITPIVNRLNRENPFFVCDIPLIESNFTKPICFTKLNCNTEEIRSSNQIVATYFAFYVCEESRRFIGEWLTSCCNFDLISPMGTLQITVPFGDSFVVHREDQSLFSLLCKKNGYISHKDISQRGNSPISYYSPFYLYKEPTHPLDTYKSILYLHKSPKFGLYTLLRSYLKKIYYKLLRK